MTCCVVWLHCLRVGACRSPTHSYRQDGQLASRGGPASCLKYASLVFCAAQEGVMSDTLLILHEDAFAPFFIPYVPRGAIGGAFGGIGLIPGRDWSVVRHLPENRVWTVSEAEGEWWINPGLHAVNRHCYLATKRPHAYQNLVFRSHRRRPVLTPIGLNRQLMVLLRHYAQLP